MSVHCTRCDGTGFLNMHQIPEDERYTLDSIEAILDWCNHHDDHDVCICDCCGDGEGWYGTPGEHYTNDDPIGNHGPYAYNGGLCECD